MSTQGPIRVPPFPGGTDLVVETPWGLKFFAAFEGYLLPFELRDLDAGKVFFWGVEEEGWVVW